MPAICSGLLGVNQPVPQRGPTRRLRSSICPPSPVPTGPPSIIDNNIESYYHPNGSIAGSQDFMLPRGLADAANACNRKRFLVAPTTNRRMALLTSGARPAAFEAGALYDRKRGLQRVGDKTGDVGLLAAFVTFVTTQSLSCKGAITWPRHQDRQTMRSLTTYAARGRGSTR